MIKILKYRYGTFLLLLSLLLFASGCSQEVINPKDEIVGIWKVDKEHVNPKGAKPPQETNLFSLVIRSDKTFTAYNVPAKFFFPDDPHYEELNGSWEFTDFKDGYNYIDLRWSNQKDQNGTYRLMLEYGLSNFYLTYIEYCGYGLCLLRIGKDTNIDIDKTGKAKAAKNANTRPVQK